MSARLFVVEDDPRLAGLLLKTLERRGYRVELHARGDTAAQAITRRDPDLVVLDLMLPGADGFDVLRTLRPAWSKPVLMLTARATDVDQVAGLELGADDYVMKPVTPEVLVARVRALLRRAAAPLAAGASLEYGDLTIVPGAREVFARGERVELPDAEYDLLDLLIRNAGRVISREELFQELRGIPYDGLDRSMDLRVSKLRSRLRAHLGGRGPIRTVHGRGYLFAVEGR